MVTNSYSCYQNYRSCGIGDSIGRLICIRIDLSCPINSIQIIGKNDTNPLNNISYKRVDLDDKVLLYSNEYYQRQTFVEFKISEQQPCLYPSEEIVKGKCIPSFNNDFYDYRYILLDNYNYSYIINSNNSLNPSSISSMGLYYRTKIGVGKKLWFESIFLQDNKPRIY